MPHRAERKRLRHQRAQVVVIGRGRSALQALHRDGQDRSRCGEIRAAVDDPRAARAEIAMIKVLAPNVACKVLDWAIQAHGGGGMSEDFPLAYMYAHSRTLRFADGPDEVHRNAVAKLELSKHIPAPKR